MQIEGTKLTFFMNFSVLDASRMPQIAQILVLISKFSEGHAPRPPRNLIFFSLAIPASVTGLLNELKRICLFSF